MTEEDESRLLPLGVREGGADGASKSGAAKGVPSAALADNGARRVAADLCRLAMTVTERGDVL